MLSLPLLLQIDGIKTCLLTITINIIIIHAEDETTFAEPD